MPRAWLCIPRQRTTGTELRVNEAHRLSRLVATSPYCSLADPTIVLYAHREQEAMARCVAVIQGTPGDTEAPITGVLRFEQASETAPTIIDGTITGLTPVSRRVAL